MQGFFCSMLLLNMRICIDWRAYDAARSALLGRCREAEPWVPEVSVAERDEQAGEPARLTIELIHFDFEGL